MTDNVNRTAAEVRQAVSKGGLGKMADGGSVLFNFKRQGLVRVAAGCDEDEVWDPHQQDVLRVPLVPNR